MQSETAGREGGPERGEAGVHGRGGAGRRQTRASQESERTDRLLRFLNDLARFGLAAGMEPLLRPARRPG